MNRIRLKDKEFELYIPEKQIREAVCTLAARLKTDLEGSNPLFVCILNGAFMFTSDLLKEINNDWEITFARYASYSGTRSSAVLQEILPVQADVKGRTLVLVEDVIDSGFTLYTLMNRLRSQGAADIKVATLLFKPDALTCELEPDYVGMRIPNDFVIGYGMDYDGLGRALRDIYKIVP
ncbi:MAG: hypoxanthine phosphoribosyltransferase [Parabacteroides sp.]|nr:hypoxanthine phosphoribosyltransferase [Parabacteroides sp.]